MEYADHIDDRREPEDGDGAGTETRHHPEGFREKLQRLGCRRALQGLIPPLPAMSNRLGQLKLRTRVNATVLVAAGIGGVAGAVAFSGVATAAIAAGVATLGIGSAFLIAHFWVARPIERLTHHAREAARLRTHTAIAALPTHRRDETGTLARCVQTLAHASMQCERDATQLRRTLDQKIAQATRRATAKLEQLAYRDPLTGLGNRRFLHSELEEKFNLAVAARTRMLCIAMDMDNFKQVNDQLGHAAGDELLKLFAELIQSHFRKDDLLARQGGDEFVIVLDGAPRQRALDATEGIRDQFRQQVLIRFANQLSVLPDISIGVAEMDHVHCRTGHQLLEAADAQLYKAKERGKGVTVGLAA